MDITNGSINWTPIVDTLNGVPEIFTPLVAIAVAIVPLVIVFSIIGFITGLFDDLIAGVGGSFRKLK
jgi:hypothetical protein